MARRYIVIKNSNTGSTSVALPGDKRIKSETWKVVSEHTSRDAAMKAMTKANPLLSKVDAITKPKPTPTPTPTPISGVSNEELSQNLKQRRARMAQKKAGNAQRFGPGPMPKKENTSPAPARQSATHAKRKKEDTEAAQELSQNLKQRRARMAQEGDDYVDATATDPRLGSEPVGTQIGSRTSSLSGKAPATRSGLKPQSARRGVRSDAMTESDLPSSKPVVMPKSTTKPVRTRQNINKPTSSKTVVMPKSTTTTTTSNTPAHAKTAALRKQKAAQTGPSKPPIQRSGRAQTAPTPPKPNRYSPEEYTSSGRRNVPDTKEFRGLKEANRNRVIKDAVEKQKRRDAATAATPGMAPAWRDPDKMSTKIRSVDPSLKQKRRGKYSEDKEDFEYLDREQGGQRKGGKITKKKATKAPAKKKSSTSNRSRPKNPTLQKTSYNY